MSYRLQHGIRDEDAVMAGNVFGNIDYGPTFDDALHSLIAYTVQQGHSLKAIEGGLFKHIPGVEGIYLETWIDAQQEKEQVWLIRRLTAYR